MIDIVNGGPYFSDVTPLFQYALKEFFIYFCFFILSAVLISILKHFSHNYVEIGIALVFSLIRAVYVYSVSIPSEFFLAFCLALILTIQIFTLNLFPFRPLDYAFLFSSLLFPTRFFNNASAVMGHLWIFWILFCTIYAGVKLCLGKIKENQFLCYFLCIFLSLSMYSYTLFMLFLAPKISDLFKNTFLGYTVSAGIIGIVFLCMAYWIRQKAAYQLLQLNTFGKKYRQIENYFSLLSVFILLIFTLLFLPPTLMGIQNVFITLLIPVLCLAFLWIQFPVFILLLRFSFYRDSATFHEWEKEGITSYYRELGQSLSTMQDMRHDIKNIFFTMGNFVDSSDNQEMKNFFWQTIYPYSAKKIEESELLSKIYQIPVESLRAFFHLKFSQALQQKLSLNVEINIIPEHFQTGIDIIDLTRILGILLDNAIEETTKLSDGKIAVKISENEAGYSYTIKNTITAATKRTGISPGKSTKGAGHGNGLYIINKLIERYPYVILNSSMQNDTYIQSLNIITNKEALHRGNIY